MSMKHVKHDNIDLHQTVSQDNLSRITDTSLKTSRTDKSCRIPRPPPTPSQGSSFEVFRNNTTAVEVIVKEVPHKFRKPSNKPMPDFKDSRIRSLEDEVERLKIDLNKANFKLVTTRKGFSNVVLEVKKQLDVMNQREMDCMSRVTALQLENEKLKTLLEYKTKLQLKLRKEFAGMKRTLKCVMKGISCVPQIPENNFSWDPEYDDFEKGLGRDCQVRFAPHLFEDTAAAAPAGGVTFDSTLSNRNYSSFDKC